MGKVLRDPPRPCAAARYQVMLPHVPVQEIPHLVAPTGLAFDIERVLSQSGRLVDEATDDAHRLISAAHTRAQGLLAKAHADSEEIAREAHQEGMALGRAAALALIEEELGEARETLKSLLASARAQRRAFIEQAENEIIALGFAVAENVLHTEIERDNDAVVYVARAAVKRLVERERVTVRVNPEDLERMRAHREEMLALGDIREVRVIGDASVDRGGVLLETDGGTLDAGISTQLEQARRALLPGETDG
jgi:flagellar assembly protein FliH